MSLDDGPNEILKLAAIWEAGVTAAVLAWGSTSPETPATILAELKKANPYTRSQEDNTPRSANPYS